MDLFDLHLQKIRNINLMGQPIFSDTNQNQFARPQQNEGLKKGGGLGFNQSNPMLKKGGLQDGTSKLNDNIKAEVEDDDDKNQGTSPPKTTTTTTTTASSAISSGAIIYKWNYNTCFQ